MSCFINAIREHADQRFFSPGAFGEIGGYPVIAGYQDEALAAWIDESDFSYAEMQKANRDSIYLDGIEDVRDGVLYYTDELIRKAEAAFGVRLPKSVGYDEIDDVAEFIIERIITPQLQK